MRLAIVGATGLVGKTIFDVLSEEKYIKLSEIQEIIPVASSKSVGKYIDFNKNKLEVVDIEQCIKLKPDIAIMSAGSDVSLKYAKNFNQNGIFVIDNSSAWRQFPDIPLVVPEINANILTKSNLLISNPNCSTIQLVVALNDLHKKLKIKKIIISTYQSVSGSGQKGINQLFGERNGEKCEMVYPHKIDLNLIPQGGDFNENGYTSEEMKLVFETEKIFNDDDIEVSPTVVRVPVVGGHSESVFVSFHKSFLIEEAKDIIKNTPGVKICDDNQASMYPMPLFAQNKDEVFVGRIRKDIYDDKALNMWIVADNLRKGAATNAVQISAYIKNQNWV